MSTIAFIYFAGIPTFTMIKTERLIQKLISIFI